MLLPSGSDPELFAAVKKEEKGRFKGTQHSASNNWCLLSNHLMLPNALLAEQMKIVKKSMLTEKEIVLGLSMPDLAGGSGNDGNVNQSVSTF